MQALCSNERKYLLRLARDSILRRLNNEKHFLDKPPFALLAEKRGVFVTLELGGCLRGCIGNILPVHTLFEGVAMNAVNAAFHDSRFPPLSKDELDDVLVEVSVLSVPVALDVCSPDDLLAKLNDSLGVILDCSGRSAVFLPQVWEQLPEKEDFLAHLSMKAGLRAGAWKDSSARFSVFTVQSFREEE